MVKKQRPVNLQLNTISFPPSAISSILHRVTGVAMFFAMLFVIWAWAVSLSSSDSFAMVQEIIKGFIGKFIAVGTASVLTYHLLAGVRHMVMDFGHWEEIESGNISAKVTIGLWVLLTIVIGVVLW